MLKRKPATRPAVSKNGIIKFTINENQYKPMCEVPSYTYGVDRNGDLWYIGKSHAINLSGKIFAYDRKNNKREVKPVPKKSRIVIETC